MDTTTIRERLETIKDLQEIRKEIISDDSTKRLEFDLKIASNGLRKISNELNEIEDELSQFVYTKNNIKQIIKKCLKRNVIIALLCIPVAIIPSYILKSVYEIEFLSTLLNVSGIIALYATLANSILSILPKLSEIREIPKIQAERDKKENEKNAELEKVHGIEQLLYNKSQEKMSKISEIEKICRVTNQEIDDDLKVVIEELASSQLVDFKTTRELSELLGLTRFSSLMKEAKEQKQKRLSLKNKY